LIRDEIHMGGGMSEPSTLTLIGFIIMLAAHIIMKKVTVYHTYEAVCHVLQELDQNETYDPFTAVELPQAGKSFSHMDYRNFPPNAVKFLTKQGIVRKTGAGKLYFKYRLKDERVQKNLWTCAIAS